MKLDDARRTVDIASFRQSIFKHMGPGPHPSGSPQSVHAGGRNDWLGVEARKYANFDDFERAFSREIKRGVYWHVTTDPQFEIDPTTGPRDMSSMGGGRVTPGALMVTSHLDMWAESYEDRQFAAQIDLGGLLPDEYRQVNRGFGNEFYIADPSKAKVVGVFPIAEALQRDAFFHDALPASRAKLRDWWDSRIAKHGGPGPHESGSDQDVHGSGGAGVNAGAPVPPAAPTLDFYTDNPLALSGVKARTRALLGGEPGTTGGGSGTEDDPFVTSDVDEAARLLAEGKFVEFTQPRQVSTLLDKLIDQVQEMKQAGQDAPNFDLCKVSVQGSNLFCAEHLGIRRINMPQLSGNVREGSQAAALAGPDGEANVADEFVQHMQDIGVAVNYERELASHLKASQMELIGAKVAGIANGHEAGHFDISSVPIFVSRDNYVIDGHHRWAALVGVDLADNKLGDLDMPIIRVDMPIAEILREANEWTEEFGLLPKGTKVVKQDTRTSLRPRINHIVEVARRGEFDSTQHHTTPVGDSWMWNPERVDAQVAIIEQLELEQYSDGMEPLVEQRAIVMLGLPGAGKTHVLYTDEFATMFDAQDFLLVAPDDIKAKLVDLPGSKYADLQGLEAAAMVHDEASMMAQAWAASIVADKTNLILDLTGSDPQKFTQRIQFLLDAGYEVSLVHVATRPEEAQLAALQRFSQGVVGPEGGRPVPPEYYEAVGTAEGASTPDQAFADAKNMVNGVILELSGAPVRRETPRVADMQVQKHMGPGPHPSGSGQEVHAPKRMRMGRLKGVDWSEYGVSNPDLPDIAPWNDWTPVKTEEEAEAFFEAHGLDHVYYGAHSTADASSVVAEGFEADEIGSDRGTGWGKGLYMVQEDADDYYESARNYAQEGTSLRVAMGFENPLEVWAEDPSEETWKAIMRGDTFGSQFHYEGEGMWPLSHFKIITEWAKIPWNPAWDGEQNEVGSIYPTEAYPGLARVLTDHGYDGLIINAPYTYPVEFEHPYLVDESGGDGSVYNPEWVRGVEWNGRGLPPPGTGGSQAVVFDPQHAVIVGRTDFTHRLDREPEDAPVMAALEAIEKDAPDITDGEVRRVFGEFLRRVK